MIIVIIILGILILTIIELIIVLLETNVNANYIGNSNTKNIDNYSNQCKQE